VTVGGVIRNLVIAVTNDWAKQRRAEERQSDRKANRLARLTRTRRVTVKQAAWEVMKEAYMLASANDTLPAAARQIMYQARNHIQTQTGKSLDDRYFTQGLLPDYLVEHPDETRDWDVVFDDRGHFTEPHTERSFGLGTLAVRDYINGISPPQLKPPSFEPGWVRTFGPAGRYARVLFIEKEGFLPILEAVKLAERFDIAPMSTKGLSVTAARMLIERLAKDNIPIFCLHDFDKSGFSILATLSRDTRRYTFRKKPKVIDLGLRLEDVRELGLEDSAEDVFDDRDNDQRRLNLLENGATEEEAKFLLDFRVELNALTANQLVEFIERKLAEHGVKKVVPHAELVRDAYRLFASNALVQDSAEAVIAEAIKSANVTVPDGLVDRVTAYLEENPEAPWDDAVAAIVNEDREP